jgi:hypothetical protein
MIAVATSNERNSKRCNLVHYNIIKEEQLAIQHAFDCDATHFD